MEFRKCNILHFLTNRHPWEHLVSDLHTFSMATENLVEENMSKVIEYQRGRLSALSNLSLMEIFTVMLIKV